MWDCKFDFPELEDGQDELVVKVSRRRSLQGWADSAMQAAPTTRVSSLVDAYASMMHTHHKLQC